MFGFKLFFALADFFDDSLTSPIFLVRKRCRFWDHTKKHLDKFLSDFIFLCPSFFLCFSVPPFFSPPLISAYAYDSRAIRFLRELQPLQELAIGTCHCL